MRYLKLFFATVIAVITFGAAKASAATTSAAPLQHRYYRHRVVHHRPIHHSRAYYRHHRRPYRHN